MGKCPTKKIDVVGEVEVGRGVKSSQVKLTVAGNSDSAFALEIRDSRFGVDIHDVACTGTSTFTFTFTFHEQLCYFFQFIHLKSIIYNVIVTENVFLFLNL